LFNDFNPVLFSKLPEFSQDVVMTPEIVQLLICSIAKVVAITGAIQIAYYKMRYLHCL
jgi:hypothetical protein